MKKVLFLLLVFTSLLLVSCVKENNGENKNDEKVIQLISDNKFENGFEISPADKDPQPENRYPLDYNLTYKKGYDKIMWLMSQAGSRYGLADEYAIDGKKVKHENNSYILEDTSKKVIIGEDGELTMEYNTSLEYLSPRVSMEAWPHLIIQQGFTREVVLDDAEKLELSLEIKMNKLERHMTDLEFNPNLHTAQFLMFIVLRSNSNLDSGEYIWFGVPFFDARYKLLPESGQFDAGTGGNTGKFIYQMPQHEFMPNGLPVGEKIKINIDLLSYFSRALLMAQSKGALLNTTVNDLYITNMNIGFEIPGTYDISISIKDLSLLAYLK